MSRAIIPLFVFYNGPTVGLVLMRPLAPKTEQRERERPKKFANAQRPQKRSFLPVFSPQRLLNPSRVCEGETVRGDPRFETASLNQTRPLKDRERERERELEGMTVVAVGVVVYSTVK